MLRNRSVIIRRKFWLRVLLLRALASEDGLCAKKGVVRYYKRLFRVGALILGWENPNRHVDNAKRFPEIIQKITVCFKRNTSFAGIQDKNVFSFLFKSCLIQTFKQRNYLYINNCSVWSHKHISVVALQLVMTVFKHLVISVSDHRHVKVRDIFFFTCF